jgi:hypothetical protein
MLISEWDTESGHYTSWMDTIEKICMDLETYQKPLARMNDGRFGQFVQKPYLFNRQTIPVTDAEECFTGCNRVISFLFDFLGSF